MYRPVSVLILLTCLLLETAIAITTTTEATTPLVLTTRRSNIDDFTYDYMTDYDTLSSTNSSKSYKTKLKITLRQTVPNVPDPAFVAGFKVNTADGNTQVLLVSFTIILIMANTLLCMYFCRRRQKYRRSLLGLEKAYEIIPQPKDWKDPRGIQIDRSVLYNRPAAATTPDYDLMRRKQHQKKKSSKSHNKSKVRESQMSLNRASSNLSSNDALYSPQKHESKRHSHKDSHARDSSYSKRHSSNPKPARQSVHDPAKHVAPQKNQSVLSEEERKLLDSIRAQGIEMTEEEFRRQQELLDTFKFPASKSPTKNDNAYLDQVPSFVVEDVKQERHHSRIIRERQAMLNRSYVAGEEGTDIPLTADITDDILANIVETLSTAPLDVRPASLSPNNILTNAEAMGLLDINAPPNKSKSSTNSPETSAERLP